MTYTFNAKPEVFLEFFERVKKQGAAEEDERIKILIQMVKEGYEIAIGQTNRTREEIVKDYSKHGKVLWIKPDTLEGGVENGDSNGL